MADRQGMRIVAPRHQSLAITHLFMASTTGTRLFDRAREYSRVSLRREVLIVNLFATNCTWL